MRTKFHRRTWVNKCFVFSTKITASITMKRLHFPVGHPLVRCPFSSVFFLPRGQDVVGGPPNNAGSSSVGRPRYIHTTALTRNAERRHSNTAHTFPITLSYERGFESSAKSYFLPCWRSMTSSPHFSWKILC